MGCSHDTKMCARTPPRKESVVTVTGKLVKRSEETVNPNIPTGEIEVRVEALDIQSRAEMLPLQVNSDEDTGEDIRLGIHRQHQSQVALPPEAVQRKQVGPQRFPQRAPPRLQSDHCLLAGAHPLVRQVVRQSRLSRPPFLQLELDLSLP